MTLVELVANIGRVGGLVVTIVGLWYSVGGLRLVVSARIDERRRSAKSLKMGLPLLILGVLLLFGGTWLGQWAKIP